MQRRQLPLIVLLAALCLLAQPQPTCAAIIGTDNVYPTDPAGWNSSTFGYVGQTSNGTLTVDAGSDLLSHEGFIGYNFGSTGVATVDGAGSTWTNNSMLFVGNSGSGTLNITDGGGVSSSSTGFIGNQSGSIGVATVDGAGSTWTNDNDFFVGNSGSGTLNITDGGGVSSSRGYIGFRSGSTGVATVDGAGSTWTNDNDLYVGYAGSGALNISSGGMVSVANGTTYAGATEGSVGVINFNNGTLTTKKLMVLSNQLTGVGTIVTHGLCSDISLSFDANNGANHTLILNSLPGQNITMNVDVSDANSASDLAVGWKGNGSLMIRDAVTVNSAYGYVGFFSGVIGTATVAGTGSKWAISDSVYVGYYGSGVLNVIDGGTVTSNNDITGSASMVTVDGVGSTWTCSSIMLGGILKITGGGAVNSIAGYTTGDTAAVTVDGSGSTLSIGDRLIIEQGKLEVTSGGKVSILRGTIASGSGVTAAATVDGVGSELVSTYLTVGHMGNGALNVSSGGIVRSDVGSIATYSGSSGVVTVDGIGSIWDINSGLTVGNYGKGTLNIVSGGAVVCKEYSWIGGNPGSTGAVTVRGAGSRWINGGELDVGYNGHGMLSIIDGGSVGDADGWIGSQSSSGLLSEATVAGAGSTWVNSGILYVGYTYAGDSYSGTLNILSGGTVTAASAVVYSSAGSLLTMDIGNGSNLTIGGGSGTLTNDGTVRFMAGAGTAEDQSCRPISAMTWSGSGAYQALGGIWNTTTHEFVVSHVQQATAGSPVSIDLLSDQRVRIDDAATGWSLGASFLSSTVSKPLSFTSSTIVGGTLAALQSVLGPDDSVLGAWQCTATGGYTSGDPAYLSLNGASNYTTADLSVWHYDGSGWSQYNATDLTCNGQWASFTVTGFSGYAVTAGPAHVTWSGSTNPTWSTSTESGNWKKTANGIAADYDNGFHVTFDDTATTTVAEISSADVLPLSVTFNNASKNFAIIGSKGIAGAVTTVLKQGAGTVTMGSVNTYGGLTTIEAGKLILQGTDEAMVPVLNNGGADIKGGTLVVDYTGEATPSAMVKCLLAESYTGSGGIHFNTGRFQSSTADTMHGLGWLDNTMTSEISVAYTVYGDTNLDGTTNFTDFSKFLSKYNQPGVWADGDTNYDGIVNFADLSKMLSTYNRSIGTLTPAPEPSSAAMLAIVAGFVGIRIMRRYRRSPHARPRRSLV